MKEALRIIYFNVAFFCVLLVGLEVTGQVAFLALKGYPVYQSDQHLISESKEQLFELHPYLVARLRAGVRVQQGEKVVTTTGIHTRSTGADRAAPGAIRIAVVGGSTTFGSGVTDEDSWPARLQALLGPGYRVTNYGMPGYSTAEGVIQLALLVPESRPDVVVLYEGWNDIRNYHEPDLGADYYRHGMKQYANLDVQRPQPAGFIDKLADVSVIGRLALVLGKGKPAARPRVAPTGRRHTEPDTLVDRIYLRNLQSLKVLARNSGAHVLFVPQVMDPSRFNTGGGSHEWTPTIVDSAMPSLIGRFNRIMNGLCVAGEAHCEVLADIPAHGWQPDDFMDEGHFVRKGSDIFAGLLAAHIKEAVARRVIQHRPEAGVGVAR